MLACTILTSIAFANNDTLNNIANDKKARALITFLNNTRFKATVRITYADKNIPNAYDYILNPGEKRDLIIIFIRFFDKVEATFEGNGTASVTKVNNFYSTAATGTFHLEESALDERQTIFECTVRKL
jgi:hypothetical protein